MTRAFMLDQLGQEYVLTARVKGVSETAVIWRHAFRNVLVQLITIIGLTYASLLEGSVLTETVFAWPGIGQYITSSLFNNDMNAVLGGTIVVGVCFVGINMLSDLLYRLVDLEGAVSATNATDTAGAWRRWLLAGAPRSRLHARCQRAYLGWLAFRRNPVAMAGLGIVAGLVACAAFAPWITGSNGLDPELGNRLRPPDAVHWFGTDELGRDIYDRIVWGARITLYIVGLVSVIVVPIGLVIGVVAGYAGGWLDNVLMRLTDVFLAFPRLILALASSRGARTGAGKRGCWRSRSPPGLPTRASRGPRRSPSATATSSSPRARRGSPPPGSWSATSRRSASPR